MKPLYATRLALMGLLALTALPACAQSSDARDPWLRPFTNSSIWNTPIGNNAQYHSVNIRTLGAVFPDEEFFYRMNSGDPSVGVTQPGTSYVNVNVNLPDNMIWNGGSWGTTPNNAAALLWIDGSNAGKITQEGYFTRPNAGQTAYGFVWHAPNSGNPSDLLSITNDDGRLGEHAGSGLSCLGGSIRRGELTGNGSIKHAIKLEPDIRIYYNNGSNSYVWPAINNDGNTSDYGRFNSSDTTLEPGSLLSIPTNVTESSLGLTTGPGKKLFHAIQDYGAYFVDGTGPWDYNGGVVINICAEWGVRQDMQAYGYDFNADSGNWFTDVKAIYGALQVVTNNSSNNIGGGGSPHSGVSNAPGFATELTVANSGFETPSVGQPNNSGSYAYTPSGGSWTFSGNAGIASNGSAFTSGTAWAPEDEQVGVIQGLSGSNGSISQSISGFGTNNYVVSIFAAQRQNYGGIEPIDVYLDSTKVGTITPTGTYFNCYNTYVFHVNNAGAHTLKFQGTSSSGDNTAFIDYVRVSQTGNNATVTVTDSASSTGGGLTDGTYKLINRNSGRSMDISGGSTSNGTSAVQNSYTSGNSQRWILSSIGGGQYTIKNVNSNQLLDVGGASTSDGATIIQWPSNGGSNQKWTLTDAGGGYYKIKNVNSGKLIDVGGASTSDGATIIQWPDNGGSNQQWSFQSP